MHMKYMLLFAKSGALRIVIGSANLVPHEWRDIENVCATPPLICPNTILCLPQYVFIQDFPRATPGVEIVKLRAGEQPNEAFPAVLVAALRATGVEDALAMMIRQGVRSFPFFPILSFPSSPLVLAHGMFSPAAHRTPAHDARSLCGHSESGNQVDSARVGLGLEPGAGGAGIERAGEVGGVGRSAWGAEVCISLPFV
jgi:hypothetical protein